MINGSAHGVHASQRVDEPRRCVAVAIPVTLELGGNDPAIVLPDVDAKALAPEIFWAAFQNNAQFCNAAKRLYVHEDVYDEVRDALVEFIEQNVKVGDGAEADTHLGPIQNSMQYGKVQDYFKDCQDNGHANRGGHVRDGVDEVLDLAVSDRRVRGAA